MQQSLQVQSRGHVLRYHTFIGQGERRFWSKPVSCYQQGWRTYFKVTPILDPN